MPSEKDLKEFMQEAAKAEETPLFLRIIHFLFHRCFFGEHWWKEPTKESSLAECTACGYMPVCPKHKERLFVHGYEYKLGCKSCRDEAYAEYLKRSGQERGSIATYTSKFKEGLVFYIDNVTEEEIAEAGWVRNEYCRVHDKPNVECGCRRFNKTERVGERDVCFKVLLNKETNRPRTLGFELTLPNQPHRPKGDTIFGDYREIKGHMHFDKAYDRFRGQAAELIKRYG